MAKKPVTMKFEPELLERIDAKAKERSLDRTAFFTMAAESALLPNSVNEGVSDLVARAMAPKPAYEPEKLPPQFRNPNGARIDDEFGSAPGWRKIDPPGSRLKQSKPAKGTKK